MNTGKVQFVTPGTSTCLECPNDMAWEGVIYDDIPLCHACYSNENLIKHGYAIISCGDCLRPECKGCI